MAIWSTHAEPRRPLSIPHHLLLQACAGVALGLLAAAGLLLTDAFGLARLLAPADPFATAIFFLGGITTLAPLVVATAIALLAETDPTPRRPTKARRRRPS